MKKEKKIKFPAIEPRLLNGSEKIVNGDQDIGIVADYWAWAHSDIIENAERGAFAEYIVYTALHAQSKTRVNWDKFDILSPEGIAIEVKTSGYLQSWAQESLSSISFSIKPTLGWDRETNSLSKSQSRQSIIYVFCLLACQNQDILNPLDLSQWEFYVLATSVLNEKVENQKTITLSALVRLGAVKTNYSDLRNVILHEAKEYESVNIFAGMQYSGVQFSHIVYETAQWLNEVLVQNERFLTEYNHRIGNPFDPWDEEEKGHNFIPERYFLISAIHHAIKNLRIVDNVISEFGDHSISNILPEIYEIVPWSGIKNLRDMNEHREEYLVGKGNKQEKYQSKIIVNESCLWTDASHTFGITNAGKIFLGNIDQTHLVEKIKNKRDQLMGILKELFYRTFPLGDEKLSEEQFTKET